MPGTRTGNYMHAFLLLTSRQGAHYYLHRCGGARKLRMMPRGKWQNWNLKPVLSDFTLLDWVPMKAEPETWAWMQEICLGGDLGARRSERRE